MMQGLEIEPLADAALRAIGFVDVEAMQEELEAYRAGAKYDDNGSFKQWSRIILDNARAITESRRK
jgi:hypothetical protein